MSDDLRSTMRAGSTAVAGIFASILLGACAGSGGSQGWQFESGVAPADGSSGRAADSPIALFLDPNGAGPRPPGAPGDPGLFVTIDVYPPTPRSEVTSSELRAVNERPQSVSAETDGVPRWFNPELVLICPTPADDGCAETTRTRFLDTLSPSEARPTATGRLDAFTFETPLSDVGIDIECHQTSTGMDSNERVGIVVAGGGGVVPRPSSTVRIMAYCVEYDADDRTVWAMRQVGEALRRLVDRAATDRRVTGIEVVEARLDADEVVLTGWVY